MKYSEPCNEICGALAKFQVEIEPIGKDSRNNYTDSRYLSLGKLLSAIRPVLGKHGIALVQDNYTEGDYVVVETELRHGSGQWIRCEPIRVRPVRAAKGSAPRCLSAEEAVTQEKAAAMTYMRRYHVFAVCGLAGEDTDGNPPQVDEPADRGGYDRDTGETRASQQSELPAQRAQQEHVPTHRYGPEVDSAISAIAVASNETVMRVIAYDLFKHHGPLGNTKAWIAFGEKSKALGLDARAVARMGFEELQRERATAGASNTGTDAAQNSGEAPKAS